MSEELTFSVIFSDNVFVLKVFILLGHDGHACSLLVCIVYQSGASCRVFGVRLAILFVKRTLSLGRALDKAERFSLFSSTGVLAL